MKKWLGRLGLALLFSLLVGLAIGTWLRLRLERPIYYIGAADGPEPAGYLVCSSFHMLQSQRRAS